MEKKDIVLPPVPRRLGRRIHSQKAMALVGIMLVLMLILASGLIGFAGMSGKTSGDLGSTSSNTLKMTQKRNNVLQAETLADAGLRAAVQWIADQPSPPINTSAFTPQEVAPNEFYANTQPDSGKWTPVNFPDSTGAQGRFRVRFYPHSDNAIAAQRGFLVESIGEFNGETRVVRADIRQKNFAQYAYFTDTLSSAFFVAGLTTFNGPVHINNSNNADMNIVWDSVSTDMNNSRLFQWDGDNAFTMWQGTNNANVGKVKWMKDTIGATPVTPGATSSDWKKIITPKNEGQQDEAIRTGPKMTSDVVAMPKTSYELRDAALGGKPEPTTNGVFVPNDGGVPTGGVYIKGQVDDMVLEASGTNNRDQVVYIYQDGGSNPSPTKWRLEMKADGTTTLQKFIRSVIGGVIQGPFVPATTLTTYSGGSTNGVIYSYDDIGQWGATDGGVSGTIANSATGSSLNKLTLATRVEGDPGSGNQKTINIDGNILYANASKLATQAPADSGVLGMVAGYIRVVNQARVEETGVDGFANYTDPDSTSPNKVRYADNDTLKNLSVHGTLMAFNTASVDNYDTRSIGDFRLLGGYIAKDASRFGQVDPTTRKVTTGFARILNYDKRVANQPPPYFPGTGQAYETLSYQRVLQPLQP